MSVDLAHFILCTSAHLFNLSCFSGVHLLGAPFPVAGSMFLLTSFCRSAKYLALLFDEKVKARAYAQGPFERISLGTNCWLVLV